MSAKLLGVAIAVLLTATAGQHPDGQPTWVADLGYQPSELHAIRIGKFGYPYLQVVFNGETLELPLDTGNMRRLVISAPLAARLHLPVIGESPSYDSSGALRGKWRIFRVDSLTALGQTWREQSAFEADQTATDGLFGPHYLLDGRFTLDYRHGLLAVSKSSAPGKAPGETLPLVQGKHYPGMPVVEGTVNGRKVLVQIDTGKSRTCVDSSLVRELGLPPAPNGYTLKEVRIGSWEFTVRSAREENFAGISEDSRSPILIGIGSDVLPQVVMTIDYRAGTIRLIPSEKM